MAVAAVHVLVFPWPLQGHINTFVPFSKALVDSGVHVTFLHTDPNLRRVRCTATTGDHEFAVCPTAKRRRQLQGRRSPCLPCVKSRAHGEPFRRVYI